MTDLIDRQAAIDALETVKSCLVEEEHQFLDCLISDMKKLPSAEPERKHGKWIKADSKSDIPKYTRIVLRQNKFYEKDSNRPRFVYCFADSEGYEAMCVPVETKETERLYTKDEVYRIIHGIEEEYGLSWGNNLIEDYL